MNENPGETPNPLNSNIDKTANDGLLDANPSEPMHENNNQNEVRESVSPTVVQPVTQVRVDSLDPTGRSMEKTVDPVATAPAKKSKKGLVFTLLGCFFLLGSIVAIVAAVMLSQPKPDAVTLAMQKLMSGDAPKNTTIDGDINILINDPFAPFKRVNIDLDSDTMVGSMINTSSAVLNLTDQSNNDYSLTFKEVYAANGDLYFMVSGLRNLLEDPQFMRLIGGETNSSSASGLQTNCIGDETGMTNCVDTTVVDCVEGADVDCAMMQSEETPSMIQLLLPKETISKIEELDDAWLKISLDDLDSTGMDYMGGNSNISCVTNLVEDVNKNSNSAIEIYKQYPFIKSTDKDIIISSKQNPVYEVWLDSKNFTEYVNAIQNTDLSKALYRCMGWKNNITVTEEDVNEIVSQMPRTYVEIDHENNFTRLFLESEVGNTADDCDCPSDADCTVVDCSSTKRSLSITIDLGFSYPANINVSEPVQYTDFKDVIQTIFMSLYQNIQDGTQN